MVTRRELIAPHGDKRFVRRDDRRRFTTDQVDVGRSLAEDRRQHANAVSVEGRATGEIEGAATGARDGNRRPCRGAGDPPVRARAIRQSARRRTPSTRVAGTVTRRYQRGLMDITIAPLAERDLRLGRPPGMPFVPIGPATALQPLPESV